MRGNVLSTTELKRLAEHKYSAQGTSFLEPLMQPFWRWVVELLPLWLAPNAITLAGLIVNAVTAFVLMLFSPDAKGEPPGWSFVLCALGLFIYQTLDAIDGKQARRTNSSSPLGELFDHGCDSVSVVLVIVSLCITLQLGFSPDLMYFECFTAMFIFYAAHWQTYCSGTLKFGYVDVTEGQWSVIALFLVTACFGPSFWSAKVPLFGVQLKLVPVLIGVAGAFVAIQSYFRVIFIQGGVGRNGSTVAGTSVLSPLIPIGVLLALGVTLWKKSVLHVFDRHPVLYVMSFGMAASKLTNKLVVAHMSKSEMEILDQTLFGPGLLFLNQYFDTFFDEHLLLWACFFICSIDLIVYAYKVCNEMCFFMNIHCFRVSRPPFRNISRSNPATHEIDSINGSGNFANSGISNSAEFRARQLKRSHVTVTADKQLPTSERINSRK